jgi:hypothetical protein
MGLERFGFTRASTSGTKRAAEAAVVEDTTSSRKITCTDDCLVGSDDPEPTALSADRIGRRQQTHPWAVYVGPSVSGHRWTCSVCNHGRKGPPVTYRFKEGFEFNRHSASSQHKQKEEAIALAQGFHDARDSLRAEQYRHDLDSAGKLLVVAAFMISNGVSLRLFPQVLPRTYQPLLFVSRIQVFEIFCC